MSWGYAPYVPVARRRTNAANKLKKKKNFSPEPVKPEGSRLIATSFWGKAWCDHIENFSDYENRLPRGRTYIRNGSVVHLKITEGLIHAMVAGSELYEVNIPIKKLSVKSWKEIKGKCAGNITSLVELLQGRLADSVMTVVTNSKTGLFPQSGQMELGCSCPDWASMCKHVAATLYGVGVRLDQSPELLFKLRGVDSSELVNESEAVKAATTRASGSKRAQRLSSANIGDVFNIDITPTEPPKKKTKPVVKKDPKSKVKKASPVTQKKVEKKKVVGKKRMPKSITGKQLERYRKSLSLTQSEFASKTKVSKASIVRWEQHESNRLSLSLSSREKLITIWGN